MNRISRTPNRIVSPAAKGCRGHRRAAAAVEFALLLPFFAVVVLGIVEFGRAMMVGQLVTNGARQAARHAIVDGSTESAVRTDVQTFLAAALSVPAAEVEVLFSYEAGPGNPVPANLSAALPQDLVKVQVQIDFADVDYFTGNFLDGKKISGYCSMRHE